MAGFKISKAWALPRAPSKAPMKVVCERRSFFPGRISLRRRNARGYRISQVKRKRIEECFGWMKVIGLMRKLRYIGQDKAAWIFRFTAAAVWVNLWYWLMPPFSLLAIVQRRIAGQRFKGTIKGAGLRVPKLQGNLTDTGIGFSQRLFRHFLSNFIS